MKVDINLVKQLREATMASLTECKKALVEAEGNLDEATRILREKGALKAAKKADRETHEGAVMARVFDNTIAGVTLFCETDFVAKNENFIALIENILDMLADAPETTTFEDLPQDTQDAIMDTIKEHVLTLGENLSLGPIFVKKSDGYVYNHTGNSISAVVFGSGTEDILKEVALQITAMDPQYLDRGSVPADIIEELQSKAQAELANDDKPDNIKEKIVAGKVSKALEDFVLLEQVYIRDGSKKVRDILDEDTHITSFIRFSV